MSDIESVDVIFDVDAVEELLRGPNGVAAKTMARTAIKCETTAKRMCAVDTGRLRASIKGTIVDEGGEIVGYVGSDVEYAIYQEMGTERMAAQPFLRPAVDMVIGHEDLGDDIGGY